LTVTSRRHAWRAWLAWLVCTATLVLLAVGGWYRASPRGPANPEGWVWLEESLGGLAIAGIPIVGALIASRLPGNPYGWLWCGIGLAAAVSGAARPLTELTGGPPWVAAFVEGYAFAAVVPLCVLAVLLFPTGRVPGPRWRWLARAVVAVTALVMLAGPFTPAADDSAGQGPLALQGAVGRYLGAALQGWVVVMFVLGLGAVWALLLRYRSAGPVERQQLTWFLYAALLAALVLALSALGLMPWRPLAVVLQAAALAVFPAAVAVAVLRYHLYEIDRIVSRTVSYGLLTGCLVALYLVLVALLRALLEPLTGSSTVAVAVSTLAVAGVFNPVRRRLQEAVDRRFDRARYDAAQAVEAFAARLRNQVDLDEVTTGMRDTVAATVAPTCVAVWLRPAGRP